MLEDGVIGTDAAREAKIEETLRKMGVQSIGEVRAEKAADEDKSVADKITSIFDVSCACQQGRTRMTNIDLRIRSPRSSVRLAPNTRASLVTQCGCSRKNKAQYVRASVYSRSP